MSTARSLPTFEEGRSTKPLTSEIEKRLAVFMVETPIRRFEELVLSEQTARQIESLLTKIKHHSLLYDTFGLREIDPSGGRTAINFYGPPGTGKSMAAEALAHELGMGLIRANYAELESKFVGETAKNIRAAFERARQTGALLFFDEADSILGRRLTNVRQSTDHAVNVSRSVMLMELDRFDGVTVFATNLASNYDTAFVRRILGHVEMKLPPAELRLRLWQAHLPERLPLADDVDLMRLSQESDRLAGGDILNAVINAASSAVQRDGPACRVNMADFQLAIAAIRAAKEAVLA
ncbi:MAG: ATP-binding protein [Chloroflexota bacterium]